MTDNLSPHQSSAEAFEIDSTHDVHARSWVVSANDHSEFPIQNLPFGIFSTDDEPPRAGIAIGDQILDLAKVLHAGLLSGDAATAAKAAPGDSLNGLMAVEPRLRRELRRALFSLLSEGSPHAAAVSSMLRNGAGCALHLPAVIGDFTDFYAGIHHATNAGRMFRPENPLLPNYKYIPVGYHGRSSSIRISGTDVRRPKGQRRTDPAMPPDVSPSQKLDFELELGIWIGAGNALGETIPIARAHEHLVGICLLNDWSARDIQAWEYQPLGPFLAKNFSTTISPWVVTAEALAPYFGAQQPREPSDPPPLPYLYDVVDQRRGALDIECEVFLLTAQMRAKALSPHRCTKVGSGQLYWTIGQLIAHHTSGGCNLRAGDLFGTGTISGPEEGGFGSLLESTDNGRRPVTLSSGETRTFLEDGDEVIFRGTASREGFASIGFGECRARITS